MLPGRRLPWAGEDRRRNINFTFPFKPDVCDEGDFCLKNIDPQWEVVQGKERFALRDGSFFNGMVKDKIDEQLREQIGDTFRLKLSGSGGKLSSIPFEAEGRVDRGRGFLSSTVKTTGE